MSEAERRSQIRRALFRAVEEVNGLLDPGARLKPDVSTPLLGDGASLDSLGLVNLLVAAEEELEQELGRAVSLTSDLGTDAAAFRTLGSLADRVDELVRGTPAP